MPSPASISPGQAEAFALAPRSLARPWFRRLRSKLTVYYLSLFLLVLSLILAAVYVSVARNSTRMLQGQLDASAEVFDRIWRVRARQLNFDAQLLAQDYGFRAAVATGDAPTIHTALANLRRRFGLDLALAVSPDGRVVAGDGLVRSAAGQAALGRAALQDRNAAVFLLDGAPYQVISAPVMAPALAGHIVFAAQLDDAEMARLTRLAPIPLEARVVIEHDGRWTGGGGGLDPAEIAYADRVLQRGAGVSSSSAVSTGAWIDAVRPIAALGSDRAGLLLRYPAAEALAPFRGLLATIAGLGLAALVLSALGGWALARQVTRPIGALKDAAERLAGGQAASVPLEGTDEIASLALAFNRMADGIHRREEALAAARAKAEAANQAKSDFLANMSHEIRTPLNGIIGMAAVMARDPLEDTQRERLGMIADSGEALLSILNSVLDLSKIEAGQMEVERTPFELAEVVRAASAPFVSLARDKGIGFEVSLERDLPCCVVGDPLRLRQVLSNLCSNAVKFTARGSVELVVAPAAGAVRFSVRDTGIGVPEDRIDEIFAKFSQVDASTTRRFGGTGLGLAICKELVALMGGALEVRSRPGEGSTFTFDLPLPEGPPPRTGPAAQSDALVTGEKTVRILAAEDNPANRMILAAMLALIEAEVVLVEDGREAVAAYAAGAFDLVLMDVQMPEMNGVEASAEIRRLECESGRTRTPILAVSANVMAHQTRAYSEAGMDGVVAKPLKPEGLFAAIEEALARAAAGVHADDG